ncbi:HAD hydrolase family protein [Streptomyces sp. MMG1121]|uniref:HAD hydrolase family protein n=1 Tax=Streptomyces sp. MMG1121 TaxID=1415544 RepID=UPI000ADD5AF3|nr:HAD hydrolase family protein [Streptomyces sp. MMG1121]
MSRPLDGVRLVCTDLDGTLLNRAGTVGPATRAALAEAELKGLPVAYVTGRPLRDALGAARDHAFRGLVVCSNGAVTVEAATGRVLDRRGFRADGVVGLLRRMRERVPGVVLGVDCVRGLYLEPGFAELVPDCWPHEAVPDAASAVRPDDPPVKVLAVHPSLPAARLDEALVRPGDEVEATRSTPYFLEISPRGVDKGTSLHRLAGHYGVPLAATAAVGDMPNDLPMLRAAGLAAAVSNAHPEVLAAADLVLPDNEREGVARLLSEICAALPAPTVRPAP